MRRHVARKGFTMIEMMFAILILSIVLLGLMSVLGSVLRNQSDGRIYETVSVAANAIFGQAGQAVHDNFDKPLIPGTFPAGRQPMTNLEGIEFEVSETLEREDLKRVDLVIYWKDKAGAERRTNMSTKFLKGE